MRSRSDRTLWHRGEFSPSLKRLLILAKPAAVSRGLRSGNFAEIHFGILRSLRVLQLILKCTLEIHLNIACGFCTSLRCVRMVCEYFRITRSKEFGSVHLPSQDFERIQT